MRTQYEDVPGCARMDGIVDSRGKRGFTPGCNTFVFRKTEEIQ